MRALTILTAAVLSGCGFLGDRFAECGSLGMSTANLGYAISKVRQARVFASTASQREALAELEAALMDAILADPDPDYREAAFLLSESGYAIEIVERQREITDGLIARGRRFEDDPEAWEQGLLTRDYRRHLEGVPREIDLVGVDDCARPRMVRLRQMAIDAAE